MLIPSESEKELELVCNFLQRKGLSQNCIEKIVGSKRKKVDKYSNEEICNAVLIQALSPKTYDTLRVNNMTLMPLPHPSTLIRRISSFVCAPGLQPELFKLLELKLSTEDEVTRQAVLVFDEMSVRECFEYSKRLKKVFGKHKKIQVVIIRENINNIFNLNSV